MPAPPIIAPAAPHPKSRLCSAWWLVLVALALAAMVILYFFNPSQYGFYPRCTLYTTTGLYCPGCGSLRAVHYLAHGEVFTALRCNPLLVLSLPAGLLYSWRWVIFRATDKPLPEFFLSARMVKILAVVVVVFTVLRNIPCAPFNYLAPP